MIDKETIDRIYNSLNIVEVVSDFVSLQKKGINYTGLCPFHNEKTPSFSVSPSRGIYKCFGCGQAGNAVNFVMEHEQLSYVEALKYIASKYHIEIVEKELSKEEKLEQGKRESMLAVNRFASEYFEKTLYNTTEGKNIALKYLYERGLQHHIIEKFKLGFCPNSGDAFTIAARNKGYKLDFLTETGLTRTNEKGSYDYFRNRVMFPVHSLSGTVIGFGGRVLEASPKSHKYLNSPGSILYNKSKTLYGIFQARQSIVKEDKCYLVEGYTDVISLHQAGIENVVASSGTSLTIEQIQQIKRFTNKITILYDSDAAGIKASNRGINMILEQDINVKVLLFPEGEDPDSYSRKLNKTDFVNFLNENEKDFILFKSQILLDNTKTDPVKRSALVSDIVDSIAIIPQRLTRNIYISECSRLLELSEESLYAEVAQRLRKKITDKLKKEEQQEANIQRKKAIQPNLQKHDKHKMLEQKIVYYLLKYSKEKIVVEYENEENIELSVSDFILNELTQDEIDLYDENFRQILLDMNQFNQNDSFSIIKQYINHPNKDISKICADILSQDYELSKYWIEKVNTHIATEKMKLSDIVPEAIYRYKLYRIQDIRDTETKRLQEAVTAKDDEQIEKLMKSCSRLDKYRKSIIQQLNNQVIL